MEKEQKASMFRGHVHDVLPAARVSSFVITCRLLSYETNPVAGGARRGGSTLGVTTGPTILIHMSHHEGWERGACDGSKWTAPLGTSSPTYIVAGRTVPPYE